MAVFNIIGCGGFTAEVLHEVEQIYADKNFEFLFFDDSKTSYEYCGCNFSVAPINDARKDIPTIITISDNVSRENIIRRLKCLGISIFPNIIRNHGNLLFFLLQNSFGQDQTPSNSGSKLSDIQRIV